MINAKYTDGGDMVKGYNTYDIGIPPAGHTTRSSTVYDADQWAELKDKPLCAESNCLDWGEPIIRKGKEVDVVPIRGRTWPGSYSPGSFPEHLEKYCFTCAFWHEKEEASSDPGTVIVQRLLDGLERFHFDWAVPVKGIDHRGFLGYSGRRFTIEFLDGREKHIVVTNDLWHSGIPPEWLAHLFKVNARFLGAM